MKLRLALVVVGMLAAQHLMALPKTLDVQYPQDQTVWMWVEGSHNEPFTPPVKADTGLTTLKLDYVNKRFGTDAAVKTAASHVCLLNPDTGNLAIRPISLDGDKVVAKQSDFKYVNRMIIRVVNDKGYAVASAVLTVMDSSGKSTAVVLTPSHQGQIDVSRMMAGKISISGIYGDNLSAVAENNVGSDRSDPVPVVKVLLSSGAAVLSNKPGDSPDQQQKSDSTKTDTQQPAAPVSPLNTLLGLVVLAGLAYGVWRLMKSRDANLNTLLQKLGVDPNAEENIPELKPIAPDKPTSRKVEVPDGCCPFCGKSKGPNGCDCDKQIVDAPAPVAAVNSTPFTSAPTVIGVSANAASIKLQISEGETIIGRDPSCELAIGGDSTVSRMHLQLIWQPPTLTAKDLGSANGSRLNGQPLTQAELHAGDMLQLGQTTLRVEG